MLATLGYLAAVAISTVMLCLNVSQMEAVAKPNVAHNLVGVIWATIFFSCGRILVYQGFIPFFLKQKPGETVKANKCAQQLLNLIFHSLSSAYLCYSLPRRVWWASDDALWNLNPEVQDYRDITVYILQMGYHTNSLAIHFHEQSGPLRREDFKVMLIHHSATVILISSSFLSNYIRGGLNVLLYHDTSDIFASLAKIVNYLGWKKSTLVSFTCLVLSWIATRLFFFPRFIMTTAWSNLYAKPDTTQAVAFVCMLSLLALHVYWFSLFINMGWIAVTSKGHVQDLSENKVDEDKIRQARGPDGDPNVHTGDRKAK